MKDLRCNSASKEKIGLVWLEWLHKMLSSVMSYETPKVVTVHNPQIGLLRIDCHHFDPYIRVHKKVGVDKKKREFTIG